MSSDGRLHAIDQRLMGESRWDFADLKAVYINCTLKRSPAVSNYAGACRPLDRDHERV